jgi:hypothetical protein
MNEKFNQLIDEIYAAYEIMGMTIPASKILYECDPIAYECALHDWETVDQECEYD